MLAGSFGLFFTLFLLFCRFLPVVAMAEVKSVMPQAHAHPDQQDELQAMSSAPITAPTNITALKDEGTVTEHEHSRRLIPIEDTEDPELLGAESSVDEKVELVGLLAEYETSTTSSKRPAPSAAPDSPAGTSTAHSRSTASTTPWASSRPSSPGSSPSSASAACFAIWLQWYCNAYDYKFMISGKPIWSLPANIPVIFELHRSIFRSDHRLRHAGLEQASAIVQPAVQERAVSPGDHRSVFRRD